jgi:hypothetical protein
VKENFDRVDKSCLAAWTYFVTCELVLVSVNCQQHWQEPPINWQAPSTARLPWPGRRLVQRHFLAGGQIRTERATCSNNVASGLGHTRAPSTSSLCILKRRLSTEERLSVSSYCTNSTPLRLRRVRRAKHEHLCSISDGRRPSRTPYSGQVLVRTGHWQKRKEAF